MNALITEIKKLGKNTETKVIRFKDNGVPEFLARLDAFEKASRKSTFMVGMLLLAFVVGGCTHGYNGPIQTADGQKMEEPDYNY